MSFPVNPAVNAASQPKLVSVPQTQRIVQDIVDCVHQLKEDFSNSKSPITDDNQVLHRFCAKLEFLLQNEMKERYSLLGKRKDYWEYFCDCLASNKGANDGIKYVKALGEHKTSLGKGRAFIRFSLVHQRLADSLQQCSIHTKTAEWYNPNSVWLKESISSNIIGTLYDLNSLHFDLSPRGYDLDNAWPSFARNTPGGGNWNVPISRRSSITSMDTLSLVSNDPSEISRLQQELASTETARSALAENVSTLEQERQKAEQSVWMTQGGLNALQEQLKSTTKKFEDVQSKYSELEQSYNKLQAEKAEQEKEVNRHMAELDEQQQQLQQERQQTARQMAEQKEQLEKERSRTAADTQALQQNLIEVSDARDKLSSKLTSMEETLEQMKSWDVKKEQQISRLEQQTTALELRNKELTDELTKNLSSRENDAASQLASAQKVQDLLSKLNETEAKNVQLQGSILELKHKCEVSEKSLQEEKVKAEDLQAKLTAEVQKSESSASELKTVTEKLETEQSSWQDSVEKLRVDLELAQTEYGRTKEELNTATNTLSKSESQITDLNNFVSKLMQVTIDSSGANVEKPEVLSCSDSEVTQFIRTCQKSWEERLSGLQSRVKAAEEHEATLTVERELVQQTVNTIVNLLPDKPDCSAMELPQRTREVETRVQSLCTQLSDATTNNSFLKEQLQLAQGEHSDTGKQLSHLEGRLLELEKALKESRAAEGTLQGQEMGRSTDEVASLEVTQKNMEHQNSSLQTQLETALAESSSKSQSLEQVQAERSTLEKTVKDLEKQVKDLTESVDLASEEAMDHKEREESLQGKLSTMQQKLKEEEETVEKFLATMASLETDKASIATEQDSLRQQLTETSSQLQTVLAEKQAEQSSREQTEKQLTELEQQMSVLKDSLQQKESEIVSLQESVQTSSQKHAEATERMNSEVESVRSELNQTKQQLEDTCAKLSEVMSLKESAEAERDLALQTVEKTSSELKEKEVSFTEEVQNLKVQLDTFRTEKEELRKSASSSQEETTKLLTDKQNLISSLQGEKADLQQHVKNLSNKRDALSSELEKAKGETEEVKKISESDKRKLSESFQQTQTSLQKDIDRLQILNTDLQVHLEQCKRDLRFKAEESLEAQLGVERLRHLNTDLRSELEHFKNELHIKAQEVDVARLEVETTKTETERLRSDSASEKSELEDNLEKLQSRFSELQTAMDALIKEKEDLTASQITLQDEVTELRADLAASADSNNFLLLSSQKVQEEKDAEMAALKTQVSELEQAKDKLSSELESSSSQIKSLEEKLMDFETEKEALERKETETEKTLTVKNKEVSDLSELVKSLTCSVSILEDDDRARREEIVKLEATLQEKEKFYTSQIEAHEQELSALQFQLSAEQLQHEESLRCMGDHETSAAEMSSRLSDQEALISDLEKELSSLQMGFETERTNQNQQLEELKSLLKSKETECRMLAEQLQKTSDKLEETSSAAEHYQRENRGLRTSLDQDIDEREEEIRTLRSDNEQLKKQLIKLVRDKAVLWQQTDALAYEHKRKSEGKWLDNSTVTKCMGCNSDFSLFLRKHHCRLCGRIFCYNCSDNWVDSTSSSRKARACSQCYTDLQHLDASIAKASLLPEDSEDDGDSNVAGSGNTSQQGSITDSRSASSLQQSAPSPDNSVYPGNENDQSSPVSFGEDVYGGRRSDSPEQPDHTSTPKTTSTAPSDASMLESGSNDGTFQVITQEEISKSIAAYDEGSGPQSLIDVPNMSSSMLLSADDLASGQINTQSETWVKPGRSFAVPISINTPYTVVSWEFTVQPKDIEFSITYHQDSQQPVSQADVVVAPTRCHSVKEPVTGELTAKQAGVYTLVFDNSYSRMTSKKIHYSLKYDG